MFRSLRHHSIRIELALRVEDEEPIRFRRRLHSRKIFYSLRLRCCDFRRRIRPED